MYHILNLRTHSTFASSLTLELQERKNTQLHKGSKTDKLSVIHTSIHVVKQLTLL